MERQHSRWDYWVILFIATLIFIPFLGWVPLFDWDELNFAEIAREMLASGNWGHMTIGYKPFLEKPPLFFWIQALTMHLLGVNEFAARLPNGIIGVITLMVLYNLGNRLHGRTFGILWSAFYAGSFLPSLYFHTALIDPLFNLWMFLAIDNLSNAQKSKHSWTKAGVYTGLAILTKGPVGLLLVGLTAILYFGIEKSIKHGWWRGAIRFLGWSILVAMVWYGKDFWEGGDFSREFIDRNIALLTTRDAGHGGPWYYHLVVLALGCFPASPLMIGGLVDQARPRDDYRRLMAVLLMVIIVVFSIVRTKIIHYSSLAYFPITYLGAKYLFDLHSQKIKWNKISSILFLFLGVLWSVIIGVIPWVGSHKKYVIPYIKDPFAVANLQADVDWYTWESIYGVLFFVLVVIGWYFLSKGEYFKGIGITIATVILVMKIILISFLPRIERYTQGAAIDFYKDKSKEECCVEVLKYKSFAHYFYTAKDPLDCPFSKEELLAGKGDKNTYFVSKNIDKKSFLSSYPHLKIIMEKNGFVFYTIGVRKDDR